MCWTSTAAGGGGCWSSLLLLEGNCIRQRSRSVDTLRCTTRNLCRRNTSSWML
ncbi:hypothetical protein PF005_g4688 [Phytophthora fragariae]|uniref:Uncharacterized protein n=1 Tax=Phytophthora fragariae TaxID=53985 RepID=A0A6A3TFM0_9STRA|nr:hypothetical protein PF003_g38841 [Phytophthora fragariae]KAE8948188.1 hypothetical protein PF009_g2252 [Phytophthora fragariae]KAE8998594.1 hypothetical protein PF011_g14986 [Phytophthora fragariae]KAE9129656.1 hypothetical protein PF007_g4805 [Phytophthora fragariae]KAE9147222.1 hypothetical protein PF006_g8068 [Phytophthora fragariae]